MDREGRKDENANGREGEVRVQNLLLLDPEAVDGRGSEADGSRRRGAEGEMLMDPEGRPVLDAGVCEGLVRVCR